MGDRANIVLKDGQGGEVFLYTHWDGYRIEALAAEGLRKAIDVGRADDAQYGGRIVTDVFLAAHEDTRASGTGAGVSGTVGDGDSHLVIIDFRTQTVTYTNDDDEVVEQSFDDFVAAIPEETA